MILIYFIIILSLITTISAQNYKNIENIIQPSSEYELAGDKKLQELILNSQRSDCWAKALQVIT